MLDFLCSNLKTSLNHINKSLVYEIRVRVGQPTRINYGGKYEFLGKSGLAYSKETAMICNEKEVESIIYSACERSIYAVEEQIRKGFITTKNGVRIGLAGEYVFTNGQPITIRNISSLCIRIPHKIKDSSLEIFNLCYKNGIRNTLILSAPGFGKTTILKDLINKISEATLKNILICDERGELCDLNIGPTCDRLVYANKSVAFESGIRAMRPDVIVTDEIIEDDIPSIRRIVFSGITVIATAHLSSYESVCNSNMNLFDFYAILDNVKIGKLTCIYDKKGDLIYKC